MSERKQLLYLFDIKDSIDAIFEFVKDLDFNDFMNDRKTRSAVIREFEVIGEAVKNLPDDIKNEYNEIQWRDIVDFRNLLTHQYFGIDFEIVWNTIKNDLPLLNKTVKTIISKIN